MFENYWNIYLYNIYIYTCILDVSQLEWIRVIFWTLIVFTSTKRKISNDSKSKRNHKAAQHGIRMQLLVPGGWKCCLKTSQKKPLVNLRSAIPFLLPQWKMYECFLFIFVIQLVFLCGTLAQNHSDVYFVLSRYQTPRNSPITHQDLKTHKTSRWAVYLKPFNVFRNRWVNPY